MEKVIRLLNLKKDDISYQLREIEKEIMISQNRIFEMIMLKGKHMDDLHDIELAIKSLKEVE